MRYYAHPSTTVLRLTTWPRGHPQEYSVEEDAYVAEYIERGWCFAETCWAALTTNFERSLDLGKFTGTKTRLHGTKGVLAESVRDRRAPPAPLLPESPSSLRTSSRRRPSTTETTTSPSSPASYKVTVY